MPIEVDLKKAYHLLYDLKQPEKALEVYDSVLKQSSSNFTAHIYKAASLEKLYYGFKDWHNEETLNNAHDLLCKAEAIAQQRGDRSKQGLTRFRFFIHYYNSKKYLEAKSSLEKAKSLGYQDETLLLWEVNLEKKLKKLKAKKDKSASSNTSVLSPESMAQTTNVAGHEATGASPVANSKPQPPKFRVDWYQSSDNITVSLFTVSLPSSPESVNVAISQNGRALELTYPILSTGSEFQYNLRLSHEVNPSDFSIKIFAKKLELTVAKMERIQWKTLEDDASKTNVTKSFSQPLGSSASNGSSLQYPSSSRKKIDWSKVEVDEEQDEKDSADAFFQSLYAGADEDTRRAMMKSFVESNGTALNTDWSEVSKGKVEPSPPEGSELKKW